MEIQMAHFMYISITFFYQLYWDLSQNNRFGSRIM